VQPPLPGAAYSESVTETIHTHIKSQGLQFSLYSATNKSRRPIFHLFPLMICREFRVGWCTAPSLTKSGVCSLQLLLVLASVVFLGPKLRGTHDHIFTVSDLRLHQSGGPGSCIYFPQKWGSQVIAPGISCVLTKVKVKVILRPTVYRTVRLGIRRPPGTRDLFFPFPLSFFFFFYSFGFVDVRSPLWREVGSVLFSFCRESPAQPFSDLSPTGLMSIVYCLYFWDSPKLEGQVPVFISTGTG
jgi:hypothetical protein